MGTRVFIGRLSHRCEERDVEKFFHSFGKIREVLLKNGYGFVEFDDRRDAEDAVYDMNGKDLCGERVSVEFARGGPRGRDGGGYGGGYGGGRSVGGGGYGPPRGGGRGDRFGPPLRTKYRLIVENLSTGVSWQDLKDYMRQAGEVTYADAHKQRRNEGVVEFGNSSDMRKALDTLDDTELNGRRIKLTEDRPGRSRSRSRSRSSTRSRSRSRSRGSRSRSRSRHSRSRSRSKSRD